MLFCAQILALACLLIATNADTTTQAPCLNDTLVYAEGDRACPPGWFRWIGNNHCYVIDTTSATSWQAARDKCVDYYAGQLMILNSYDENLLLSQLAYGYQLDRVWVTLSLNTKKTTNLTKSHALHNFKI